jgi:hypothetical protein
MAVEKICLSTYCLPVYSIIQPFNCRQGYALDFIFILEEFRKYSITDSL